jgi:hypothetical protein
VPVTSEAPSSSKAPSVKGVAPQAWYGTRGVLTTKATDMTTKVAANVTTKTTNVTAEPSDMAAGPSTTVPRCHSRRSERQAQCDRNC